MTDDYVKRTAELMRDMDEINKKKYTKLGVLHSISRFFMIFYLYPLVVFSAFFEGYKYILFIYNEIAWYFVIFVWFISLMGYFYTRRLLKIERNLRE